MTLQDICLRPLKKRTNATAVVDFRPRSQLETAYEVHSCRTCPKILRWGRRWCGLSTGREWQPVAYTSLLRLHHALVNNAAWTVKQTLQPLL